MKSEKPLMSSGMAGLDRVLQGLLPGDNVVWEVEEVADYAPVLPPFAAEARRLGRRLVYFRFARHEPLLEASCGAEIHVLHPQEGFERFLTGILDIIESVGRGAFYVFDCLSDLAADWYSDRMLGNFFMIACPYLYELDTLAYFALLKSQHSFQAIHAIVQTAQVIIEVYRTDSRLYIHPQKVWQRYSPSMYSLHRWEGDQFLPVTSSATITDILTSVSRPSLEFTVSRPGIWLQTFQQARDLLADLEAGRASAEDARHLFARVVKMVLTRDERFLALAEEYFHLADLVGVMQRMVGTGLVGGKSLGMLLARAILRKADPQWEQRLESHDSFYVGSDVFYTYLVQNGCWWLRRRRKDFASYLRRAEEARQKILAGTFPEVIQNQFMEMLEYFGQSPLIVRSSSLLEDNYGNAFSGKYESVFLANQGSPQERLTAFLQAVRTVYASTMSEEGLRYRLHHGLLDRDEQMALLVQRVSGELCGSLFFPHLAGVGLSFNPFVWNQEIDPEAGMLRLVFGLGTRAVDRNEDDYTRLVALNAPRRRPDSRAEDARAFTQRRVDAIDLAANQFVTRKFEEVAPLLPQHLLDLFTAGAESRPDSASGGVPDMGFLSFDRLLARTDFVPLMRELCARLQQAYRHPVDIEFTANFLPDESFRLNLVQCRPFQVKVMGEGSRVRLPEVLDESRVLFRTRGPIIGHSLATPIDRLIYVVPSAYSKLNTAQRYSVARAVGQVVHLELPPDHKTILLAGPGRWATSMPWLGVPVSFAEINKVSVICELAVMHEGLIPDVSLGTHFFNDLVELDMLYLAIIPGREGHGLNESLICSRPNLLARLVPAAAEFDPVLRVVDLFPPASAEAVFLHVDSRQQTALCYWSDPANALPAV